MPLIYQDVVHPENAELCSYRRELFHLIGHVPDPETLCQTVILLQTCFASQHWFLPALSATGTLRWDLPPVSAPERELGPRHP